MLYKYVKNEIEHLKPEVEEVVFRSKHNIKISLLTILSFALGVTLLSYSFYPYISEYFSKIKGSNTAKSLLIPSQINDFSNPIDNSVSFASSSYISNVNKNIAQTNKALNITEKTFPEYANIKGNMKITIPKLGIKDLLITLNVNSFEENQYMPLLESSLAHFQGTSLPDKEGNTFVYGHSVNVLLAKTNPQNPKYAFTFLNELQIGDEIIINYNNKEYTYSMQKMKFVAPEDITPIYTTSNDKTLTLMSCWTPGVASERIIVTSKLINERDLS